jgi:hypothetical protein
MFCKHNYQPVLPPFVSITIHDIAYNENDTEYVRRYSAVVVSQCTKCGKKKEIRSTVLEETLY